MSGFVNDVPVEIRAPIDMRPLAQAEVGAKTLGYLDAVLVDRDLRPLLVVVRFGSARGRVPRRCEQRSERDRQ